MSFDAQDPDAIRAEIDRLRHSTNPWDHKRADELALGPLRQANTNSAGQPDGGDSARVNEANGRNAAEKWENH